MSDSRYAKVAVDGLTYAVDKPFDYLLPADMGEFARVGQRVLVPFGRGNRLREGLILAVEKGAPGRREAKPIRAILDDEPCLDDKGVKLAVWLRENCFCTLFEAVRAMLPAGFWFAVREDYFLAEGVNTEEAKKSASPGELAILEAVLANGGSADVKTLGIAFGEKNFRPYLRTLLQRGVLEDATRAKLRGTDKTENMICLSAEPEEAVAFAARKRKSAPVQARTAELLAAIGAGWSKEICDFTGAGSATFKALEKAGLISIEPMEVFRKPEFEDTGHADEAVLSQEQEKAFSGLREQLVSPKPQAALLFGVTGSGKTQVYIQLIREALELGRGAIVLVPEISLTPQLMSIFSANFGDLVALMHSALRSGERYDEYKRIRSGKAKVILGTRSAVFAPVENLGLIIIDEEQERSYKSENTPRYHARQVAKYRCGAENALLLLGSATPDIESAWAAREGRYHSYTLERRYNDNPLPAVMIADMKKELRSGNPGLISDILKVELLKNIAAGRQSILFINRRGDSRLKTCTQCGYVHTCPNCSVAMTWHSAGSKLMCHYCGHTEGQLENCPQCGGMMKYVGAGTQKVQQELEEMFPGVGILRMDADTVAAAGSHNLILTRFKNEKTPILLGTQMVTKGLDFENVTLVGVLAADISLYVDDYRAGERTFSLITQVVGRAGRGDMAGRAVIQTYTPENETIRFAARQDYRGFYSNEIRLRRLQDCPPFFDMIAVTAAGLDEAEVLRTCTAFKERLKQCISHDYPAMSMKILGPAPYQIVKMNSRYRWKLTLLCKNNRETRGLLGAILREFSGGKVGVYIDVDP